MGCSSSFDERAKNSVHENMLASVMCGALADDDYLAISHRNLGDLIIFVPNNQFNTPDNFMDINNAYMMLARGYQPLEHGFHRRSDGCWYIACLSDL